MSSLAFTGGGGTQIKMYYQKPTKICICILFYFLKTLTNVPQEATPATWMQCVPIQWAALRVCAILGLMVMDIIVSVRFVSFSWTLFVFPLPTNSNLKKERTNKQTKTKTKTIVKTSCHWNSRAVGLQQLNVFPNHRLLNSMSIYRCWRMLQWSTLLSYVCHMFEYNGNFYVHL